MSCIKQHIDLIVPACGNAVTSISAPFTDDYQFTFSYLGQVFCKEFTATTGDNLTISGNWFNEGATVIGHFTRDGLPVTDPNGVSTLHIQVMKKTTL